MARKDLNEIFVNGINENRLSFYKTAKAILKSEEDVEDALQDALEMAYKNIEKLNEERYFKTWMTRIIINKCYDILRKKSKVIPFESEFVENVEEKSNFSEKVEMQMILDKLDKDFKEIVILYYYNNFKQDEIARILDIPKGTVKSRLHRAKSEILRILNSQKGVI